MEESMVIDVRVFWFSRICTCAQEHVVTMCMYLGECVRACVVDKWFNFSKLILLPKTYTHTMLWEFDFFLASKLVLH